MENELEWVLFTVLLLVLLLSTYLFKLVFAIAAASKLSKTGKRILSHTEQWLSSSSAYLLRTILIWAAVVLLLTLLNAAPDVTTTISKICQLLVLVAFEWFLYCLLRLIGAVLHDELSNWNPDWRNAVQEMVTAVAFAVFVVITVLTLDNFLADSNNETEFAVVRLFIGLNLVTGVLAVSFIPILRDVVGGLTLINDSLFHVGNCIEVIGYSKPGRLLALHLRSLDIEMPDCSVLSVPNRVLQDSPVVVYPENKAHIIHFDLSLNQETPAALVKQFVELVKEKIFYSMAAREAFKIDPKLSRSGSSVVHSVQVALDETLQSEQVQVVVQRSGRTDIKHSLETEREEVNLSNKDTSKAMAVVTGVWRLRVVVPLKAGPEVSQAKQLARSKILWLLMECSDEVGVKIM